MTSRSGTLAVRLALSFVTVAVLAVGIGAGLAALLSNHDINVMVQQRQTDLTRSLLADAAATYGSGQPGWSDADLRPALALASQSGTDVAVLDTNGQVVATTLADPTQASGSRRTPITTDGVRIGTLVVEFNKRGLVASADNLRRSLLTAVIGAAGLAAVLALIVGLAVARRLTRPVERLIAAARAMAAGDRDVRVGRLERSPSELRELGSSFDVMAETMMSEERLRRGVVADVAHELRTPIAILQASTEALVDGVVDHTQQQTLSLHEEVLRLARMVDDLQSLASAEAAALDLRLSRCDLSQVAAGAIESLTNRASAGGLTITSHLLPAPVDGDPTRLHQIVTNLLSNAVKFTPPGGSIMVSVSMVGEYGRLLVEDTGVGISDADSEHIFDRFWRGPGAESVAGSGIGLSVVAELVRAHRGTVRLEQPRPVGTAVVVDIPRAEVSE